MNSPSCRDALRSPLLIAVALCGCAGCRPAESGLQQYGTDRAATTARSVAEVGPPPIEKLRGTWEGTCYESELGIYHPTKPLGLDENGRPSRRIRERRWRSTVKVVLETEEKSLTMPGAEACWITLTYRSEEAVAESPRDMYLIRAVAASGDDVSANAPGFTLRGPFAEFTVAARDEGLELAGRVAMIGNHPLSRVIRVQLRKSADAVPGDATE